MYKKSFWSNYNRREDQANLFRVLQGKGKTMTDNPSNPYDDEEQPIEPAASTPQSDPQADILHVENFAIGYYDADGLIRLAATVTAYTEILLSLMDSTKLVLALELVQSFQATTTSRMISDGSLTVQSAK